MLNENTIEIINQNYIIEIDNPEYSILAESTFNIDYSYSANKPQINSIELVGDKSGQDLGLVSVSDMAYKEDISNKVISLNSDCTDLEYPSAKCVNDELLTKANVDLTNLSEIGQAKFDEIAGEFNEIHDIKVSKSGDTMTGNLTISTADSGYLQYVKTSINFGNAPASQQNIGGFRCYAGSTSDSNMTAIVQGYIRSINEKSSHGIQFVTKKPDNSAWGAQMRLESLADGQALFEFPKCTAKATTTSSAANNKVAVIVQNYVNGTSWYRVWSDGWIEQGGRHSAGDSVSVTLLKAFSNTNYTVSLTGTGSKEAMTPLYNTLTTSSFKVKSAANGTLGGSWRACGY